MLWKLLRGRNGFGLIDEIEIDARHVQEDPDWRVAGTLLHQLLHAWQDHTGRSGRRNYHNLQFRDKARSLGLEVSECGDTEYLGGNTPFVNLLHQQGIIVPELLEPQKHRVTRAGSKLKLYECGCGDKIRCGKADLDATCNKCGSDFVLKEKRSPRSSFENDP